MLKLKFLLLLAAGSIIPFASAHPNSPAESNPTLEVFFHGVLKEFNIPGLAVAKVKHNEVLFKGVYGFADIDRGVLVGNDTMFNVASISKPIMGITLLQLVEQQKLDLNTDINRYLSFRIDNPNISKEKITLRHLASHSSSIDDYYDPESFTHNKDPEISLESHLRSLLTPEGKNYQKGHYYLRHQPGQYRKYSNLGAGLAGALVEATTGIPLAQYSRQTLFDSLHMDHTAWLLQGLNFSDLATPYGISSQGELIAYPHIGNPQYPDGGVRASISDLSHLMTAILKNTDDDGQKLLTDKLYAEMFKLQLPKSMSTSQRFFWADNSMGLTGHMGADLGTFAAFYFSVEENSGIIILMNIDMNEESTAAMKKIAFKLMEL